MDSHRCDGTVALHVDAAALEALVGGARRVVGQVPVMGCVRHHDMHNHQCCSNATISEPAPFAQSSRGKSTKRAHNDSLMRGGLGQSDQAIIQSTVLGICAC